MFVVDALHHGFSRRYVERSGLADRDTPHVYAGLQAARHHGANMVSGREAEGALGAHEVSAREAVAVESCSTVAAAPGRLEVERRHLSADEAGGRSDDGGVEGVGLGDAETRTVPLGAAAGEGRDG